MDDSETVCMGERKLSAWGVGTAQRGDGVNKLSALTRAKQFAWGREPSFLNCCFISYLVTVVDYFVLALLI
jgi:hypothetical protein